VAPLVALNITRQVNALVILRFAAQVGEGAVSWLNYSYSVAQAPVGVADLVLFSSVLPFSAALAAQHDQRSLDALFASTLRLLLYVLAPAAAWIYFWRQGLVSLLFGSQSFTRDDTAATAACLAAYAIAIVPWCTEALVCRFLFALKRHWLYFLIVVLRVMLNLLMCLLWGPLWGAPGLAAAFAASFGASALLGIATVRHLLNARRGSMGSAAALGRNLAWVGGAALVVLLSLIVKTSLAGAPPSLQLGGSGLACLAIIGAGVVRSVWTAPNIATEAGKETEL
jgi:peptidoglycan biosynthesis protein MviN/MurJ (putative lipid II flippase)